MGPSRLNTTSVLLIQYFLGDKIKKNLMGGTCNTHGGG
jgi:hypothetical protein